MNQWWQERNFTFTYCKKGFLGYFKGTEYIWPNNRDVVFCSSRELLDDGTYRENDIIVPFYDFKICGSTIGNDIKSSIDDFLKNRYGSNIPLSPSFEYSGPPLWIHLIKLKNNTNLIGLAIDWKKCEVMINFTEKAKRHASMLLSNQKSSNILPSNTPVIFVRP